MNKYVSHGIIFVLGAAVGAAPGYFIARKQFAEELDRAVADVKRIYKKAKTATGKETHLADYIQEDNLVTDKLLMEAASEYIGKYNASVEKAETTEVDGEDMNESTMVEFERELDFHESPKLITAEECGEGPYHFDTIMLTFFSDEILTDDDFAPMDADEIEATTGMDIDMLSTAFNDDNWDEDHLYIRNFERHIDYEIAYGYSTYQEHLEKHPYLTE